MRETESSRIGERSGPLLAVYVSANVSILQHKNHTVKDLALQKREARHSHIGKNPGSLLRPYRGHNIPNYQIWNLPCQALTSLWKTKTIHCCL